jgi:L-fuculose-phosphate aldolase
MEIVDDLVKYGKFLHSHGLVIGAGGNISARAGDVVYIKKRGINMSEAGASDYAPLSLSPSSEDPQNLSSETPMHIASYKSRKDILALAHTHSPYAISAAQKLQTLESPSYEFDCIIGKSIPVLPYIEPGSPDLAEAVASCLAAGVNGVLMKQHGVVAVGENIAQACLRTLAIERAALVACHL